MTAKRWALIRTITGAGPLTIREIARRVHRDVKAVHGDVHALLNCGVLQRNDSLIVFPYDAVRVDFVLRAAQLNSLIRRVFEAAGIDFTGGLVLQVVEDLRRTYDIANMTVELLGMAFKAEIEDTRASLSYKLKRTLQMSAREGHSSANALRRERIAIFEVAEY